MLSSIASDIVDLYMLCKKRKKEGMEEGRDEGREERREKEE